jgi:hypothetical protein
MVDASRNTDPNDSFIGTAADVLPALRNDDQDIGHDETMTICEVVFSVHLAASAPWASDLFFPLQCGSVEPNPCYRDVGSCPLLLEFYGLVPSRPSTLDLQVAISRF